MLTHEQANRLADEVLLRARTQDEPRPWWLRRIPWLLRCPELNALPPHERQAVVSLAQDHVHAQFLRTYLLVTLAVVGGGAMMLMAGDGPEFDLGLALYVVIAAMPSIIYARFFVRPQVQELATARWLQHRESGF